MKRNQSEQRKLDRKLISNANSLKNTMESEGWHQIVQPLLDKMIQDCIGFKKSNGEWNPGAYVNFKENPMEISNMFAYRQALIEFNNNLMSYFKMADEAKNRLKTKESDKEYIMPLHDTSYATNKSVSVQSGYGGGGIFE